MLTTGALFLTLTALGGAADPSAEVARLADEVSGKGWIVFAARSEQGDWELFLMQPDGSRRRALTRTAEWNEAAPQFSRMKASLLPTDLLASCQEAARLGWARGSGACVRG